MMLSDEVKSTKKATQDIINDDGAAALFDGALTNAIRVVVGSVAVLIYDSIANALFAEH
jgi:hypothetical protein